MLYPIQYIPRIMHTFSGFVSFFCGSVADILPLSVWVTLLKLGQSSYDCGSASETDLRNKGKCIIWIHKDSNHMMTSSNGWRHQMETFSALLALCAGNSSVTGEFPTQRPVTRSFDVSFDLRLNKRLSKQSWVWWFETPSRSSWRHRNDKET